MADYERAQSEAKEAAELSQKILDARLALTRLRQTHPAPRLTVEKASALLDERDEEIVLLQDEVRVLAPPRHIF